MAILGVIAVLGLVLCLSSPIESWSNDKLLPINKLLTTPSSSNNKVLSLRRISRTLLSNSWPGYDEDVSARGKFFTRMNQWKNQKVATARSVRERVFVQKDGAHHSPLSRLLHCAAVMLSTLMLRPVRVLAGGGGFGAVKSSLPMVPLERYVRKVLLEVKQQSIYTMEHSFCFEDDGIHLTHKNLLSNNRNSTKLADNWLHYSYCGWAFSLYWLYSMPAKSQ